MRLCKFQKIYKVFNPSLEIVSRELRERERCKRVDSSMLFVQLDLTGFAEWEIVVEIARKERVSIGMRMNNAGRR